jgi:hypothetical protein
VCHMEVGRTLVLSPSTCKVDGGFFSYRLS